MAFLRRPVRQWTLVLAGVLALGGCFSPTDIDASGSDTEATDGGSTAGMDTGTEDTVDPTAPTTAPVDSTGCTPQCDVDTCNGDMLDQCIDDGSGCLVIQIVPCDMGCADGACIGVPAELAISIISATWIDAQLHVSYVVANLGAGPSGEYRVDLWHSRPAGFDGPPAVGDVGDLGIPRESLAPNDAMVFTDMIPGPPSGSHVAYAIVDTDQQVFEGDENNNVSLGFAWTDTGAIYTSFGVPQAPILIPDDGTPVESTLTVAGDIVAAQSWVTLNITHSEVADLTIELVAPDASVRTLVMAAPSGPNFGGTTFREGVGTLISDSAAPFVGEFEPATAWAVDPALVVGDWTLRITDTVPGNAGQVNDWSVSVEQL